ncbi:hypothetical protein L1887_00613 [Cichorium endivia]|nr:hypothetical protein L1887_00613 [Cichorium endivia]
MEQVLCNDMIIRSLRVIGLVSSEMSTETYAKVDFLIALQCYIIAGRDASCWVGTRIRVGSRDFAYDNIVALSEKEGRSVKTKKDGLTALVFTSKRHSGRGAEEQNTRGGEKSSYMKKKSN